MRFRRTPKHITDPAKIAEREERRRQRSTQARRESTLSTWRTPPRCQRVRKRAKPTAPAPSPEAAPVIAGGIVFIVLCVVACAYGAAMDVRAAGRRVARRAVFRAAPTCAPERRKGTSHKPPPPPSVASRWRQERANPAQFRAGARWWIGPSATTTAAGTGKAFCTHPDATRKPRRRGRT